MLDVSDSNSPFAAQRKEARRQASGGGRRSLPPAEATPSHEITEADGGMLLKVSLPELTSLGEAEVEISATYFFCAPGLYRLSLEWPQPSRPTTRRPNSRRRTALECDLASGGLKMSATSRAEGSR